MATHSWVFLPGEFHGQRSLAGYSARGRKESDTPKPPTLTYLSKASPMAQRVKNLPTRQEMQETWVWSLVWEDLLEKEIATHSSILAWKTPRKVEPGRLQSMGSQRVGDNWMTEHKCLKKINWGKFPSHDLGSNPKCLDATVCLHAQSLNLSNTATPWVIAHQTTLFMGFSRKNTGVDCHFFLQRMLLVPFCCRAVMLAQNCC